MLKLLKPDNIICDYNDDPPTEGYHVERTEYKFMFQKGSIVNAYQFDAQ